MTLTAKALTYASVLTAIAIAVASPSLASTAASSAYDASVNLSVGGLSVALPPVNPVGGAAPAAYSLSNSVASFSNSQTLGLLGLPLDTFAVTTQILNSSASGTATAATGSASIQNLDAVLSIAAVPVPLVELTATTIASMSTAGGGAPTGSSTIEGVRLSGSLVGAPVTFTIPSDLPANDVVFNLGGVKVVLNEQYALPGGIATNAIDIMLDNASYGGSLPLSGNLILSHSQAQVFGGAGAVPEPAAWAEMVLGFGILGGLARRRKAFATA
jgi:hypothetical protein